MIGSAPKLVAFAITMRLLVDGLLPLAIDWQQCWLCSPSACFVDW